MIDNQEKPAAPVEAYIEAVPFLASSEKGFLAGFANLLERAVDGRQSAVITEQDSRYLFHQFSEETKELLGRYLESPTFQKAIHTAVRTRNWAYLEHRHLDLPDQNELTETDAATSGLPNETESYAADLTNALESESVPSRDAMLTQQLVHFFIPILHENPCRWVVWLTRNVSSIAEAKGIAIQLRNLAFLSKLRQQAVQNTAQLRQITEGYEAKLAVHQNELESTADQINVLQSTTGQVKNSLSLGQGISKSLEKEKSAFQIASELKEFLGVERISVIDLVGKKHSLIAVSGQPTIDKRSNIVRATQDMITNLGLTDQVTFFEGELSAFPESTHAPLQRYLDESLTSSFAVLPLLQSTEQIYESEEQSLVEVVNPGRSHVREVTGAIIAEQITQPLNIERLKHRWEYVRETVSNQHNNSKRYSELLFLPAQLTLTKFFALYRGHTKRIAFGITGMILGAILLTILIPADFRVRCEGVVQPQGLYTVYSKEQAIVSDLAVGDGDEVSKGDVLIRFFNEEIESELARAEGELDMMQNKFRINSRRRVALEESDPEARNERQSELASEASNLQIQIDEKKQVVEILRRRVAGLTIKAPMDGRVIGWNIDRRFTDRALESGIKLFSLAPIDAPWLLELKVPDKRAGYINSAFSAAGDQSLPARFTLASNPSTVFKALVNKVNPGLEEDSDLGYVLPIEAEPVSELPKELRSGTPVIAKVKCGRRSFLYCKTYEFRDWVNRLIFEYIS